MILRCSIDRRVCISSKFTLEPNAGTSVFGGNFGDPPHGGPRDGTALGRGSVWMLRVGLRRRKTLDTGLQSRGFSRAPRGPPDSDLEPPELPGGTSVVQASWWAVISYRPQGTDTGSFRTGSNRQIDAQISKQQRSMKGRPGGRDFRSESLCRAFR